MLCIFSEIPWELNWVIFTSIIYMIWLIPIYKHRSLDKHKLFTEVFGPLPKYLPKYFKKIETRRPYSPKGLRRSFELAYRTLTEVP